MVIGIIYVAKNQVIQKIMAWAQEGAGKQANPNATPSAPEPGNGGQGIPSQGVQCIGANGAHYVSQTGTC